jgi:hypothetical protein
MEEVIRRRTAAGRRKTRVTYQSYLNKWQVSTVLLLSNLLYFQQPGSMCSVLDMPNAGAWT